MKPTTKTFITIVSTFAVCMVLHITLCSKGPEPTEQEQEPAIDTTITAIDTVQVITSNTVK